MVVDLQFGGASAEKQHGWELSLARWLLGMRHLRLLSHLIIERPKGN